VEIDGTEVRLATPRGARRQGIAVIYQEFSLVPQMSVAENIVLGEEPDRFFHDPRRLRARAERLLEEVGMAGGFRLDAVVGSLSAGDQQRVEIAKALVRQAKVVVLDEPTARLAGPEREQLIELMHTIAKLGTGLVFISHLLDEVIAVTTEVTVLRDGVVVAEGPTSSFGLDSLSAALVGRQLAQEVRSSDTGSPQASALLQATDLSGGRQVRDVSLVLRSGEILGVAGLVGSGRSTLARMLVGAKQPTGGISKCAEGLCGSSTPDTPFASASHSCRRTAGPKDSSHRARPPTTSYLCVSRRRGPVSASSSQAISGVVPVRR
jgi:ABC-type sugar transport system ATPase subunit